jgi:hypothetical protein
VERTFSGGKTDTLTVTALENNRIICGDYEFDCVTGAEIDEEIGWGPLGTGSYIDLPHMKKNFMDIFDL